MDRVQRPGTRAGWVRARRLRSAPAYLATVTEAGTPRVHPVTPLITSVGLFLFMEPSSPKGRDLREGRACALHNGVPDNDGSGGEFWITGRGMPASDDARPTVTAEATFVPSEDYVLFELLIGEARARAYGDVHLPDPSRWTADR